MAIMAAWRSGAIGRSANSGVGKGMAIDEIHLGSCSGYVTVVMDLSSGAVIEVAEGKHAAALDPFWKRLKHSRAQIEAVATDMGPAYIKAVRENLPKAALVFDHFHVIKLYSGA
jgi:transposase